MRVCTRQRHTSSAKQQFCTLIPYSCTERKPRLPRCRWWGFRNPYIFSEFQLNFTKFYRRFYNLDENFSISSPTEATAMPPRSTRRKTMAVGVTLLLALFLSGLVLQPSTMCRSASLLQAITHVRPDVTEFAQAVQRKLRSGKRFRVDRRRLYLFDTTLGYPGMHSWCFQCMRVMCMCMQTSCTCVGVCLCKAKVPRASSPCTKIAPKRCHPTATRHGRAQQPRSAAAAFKHSTHRHQRPPP